MEMQTTLVAGLEMRNPFEGAPEVEKTCPQCGGSGRVQNQNGDWVTCPRCNGQGFILSRG